MSVFFEAKNSRIINVIDSKGKTYLSVDDLIEWLEETSSDCRDEKIKDFIRLQVEIITNLKK